MNFTTGAARDNGMQPGRAGVVRRAYCTGGGEWRKRPKATQLFYALSKLEKQHVQQMKTDIKDLGSEWEIAVDMFDGFIALSTGGEPDALINI